MISKRIRQAMAALPRKMPARGRKGDGEVGTDLPGGAAPAGGGRRAYRIAAIATVAAVAIGAGQLVETTAARKPAPPKPERVERTAAGPAAAMPAPQAGAMPAGEAAVSTASGADSGADSGTATGETALAGPAPGPAPQLAALGHEAPGASLPDPAAPQALPQAAPPAGDDTPAAAGNGPDCTPVLQVAAAPRAMIAVTLAAPCHGGARVVLRHDGLTVAESLDADGKLAMDLPAFDAAGRVSILLPDATTAEAQVEVPGLDRLRRFAVSWMADDAFQLAALENGAGYGDPGQVSAENPLSPQGGLLVSLGDPGLDLPMRADVYTWPADPAADARPVIEAAVTELTCGREILGRTLLADHGQVTASDLSLAMPDCDALGDILVLNNPVAATTLAAAR